VHRPISEQLEDRGAHVTAPAAAAATRSAASTATAEARPEPEAGAEAAGGAEAAEAGVTAVFADVVAEFATGLPPLFVQRAVIYGAE
jgi:hypothetical protein